MKTIRMIVLLLAAAVLAGCTAAPAETLPEPVIPPIQTETLPPEPIDAIVETGRATILAGGDLMMHIPLINSGKTGNGYDFSEIFCFLRDRVSAADFAVANLETTLAGTANGSKYSGFPKFNCPDALADAVKSAGFDMLLTANNHCNDTGAYGFARTQQVIRERELLHLGTTENPGDSRYQIVDLNGIRIGMICYTYGQIDDAGQKWVNVLPVKKSLTEQINLFNYDKTDMFYEEIGTFLEEMRREGAEKTVVFLHWGNEYKLRQNENQTAIAQNLCDLGVDVIIGGHPHVVQPVELLTSRKDAAHETLCFYSVGNLLSNQRRKDMDLKTGHTEDGALVSVTFVKYSDGSVYLDSMDILPTWVSVQYGSRKYYRILPLDKEVADWAAAYGLGQADYQETLASYDRTMEIVGSGMAAVKGHLEDARTARACIVSVG